MAVSVRAQFGPDSDEAQAIGYKKSRNASAPNATTRAPKQCGGKWLFALRHPSDRPSFVAAIAHLPADISRSPIFDDSDRPEAICAILKEYRTEPV
ncbi:MAG: hypothetical protein ACFB8W_12315 [Elainellaceae cyanobacterium]